MRVAHLDTFRHHVAMHIRRVALGGAFAFIGCASGVRSSRIPTPYRDFAREIRALIAQEQFQNAHLGVLIVNPARGDTLFSESASRLFVPASNQKILTGAVALAQLGPAFRFSTSVFADGTMRDGVIEGDLRVVGMGDPTMSDHMMGNAMRPVLALADSLAARGVRRVTGALVSGGDAFPDAALGSGWSWDDLDEPYAAGVDELYFNEGFFQLDVWAGSEAGATPRVRVRPNATFPPVRVAVVTVPRGGDSDRARLTLLHDSTDATSVVVSGTIAQGDSATLSLSYRDQTRAFLEAFRSALRERGIVVDAGIGPRKLARSNGFEPTGTLLASLVSPPLPEVLAAFEKPSQNQLGEILLKSIGRARTGVGSADSGLRVFRDQLGAWGVAPNGFVARDGSGLSRYNVVSPQSIVRVLDAMWRAPTFGVFYNALPIAGVDGSLQRRMVGTPAQGNVHAKTGTLAMVRSMSGYVTTADGTQLIFSLLANHFTVPTSRIDALHEAIVNAAARLRLPPRRGAGA